MQILKDITSYVPDPDKPLYLALGNFDGLHKGHKELLKHVVEKARENGGVSAVFTFLEHPQRVLHPDSKPELLTSTEHKLYLLLEFGIEACFLIPFTQEFSMHEPEEFIEKILVEKLRCKEICLGYNARFGRGRRGDARLMKKMAALHGFEFQEMPPVTEGGEAISSTAIREFVKTGDLDKAARFLGRPFSVYGTVVHGAGRGEGLGFPTANLEIRSEVMPPEGVYPVELRMLECEKAPDQAGYEQFCVPGPTPWVKGILNYGSRPTFEQGSKAVPEVFVFDFDGDLYGRTLEVVFGHRLRPEKSFKGPEALKEQIRKDIMEAQKYFEGPAKEGLYK